MAKKGRTGLRHQLTPQVIQIYLHGSLCHRRPGGFDFVAQRKGKITYETPENKQKIRRPQYSAFFVAVDANDKPVVSHLHFYSVVACVRQRTDTIHVTARHWV